MLKVFKNAVYMPQLFHIMHQNDPTDCQMAYCFNATGMGAIIELLDAEKAKNLCPECLIGAYRDGYLKVTESIISKEVILNVGT